MKLFYFSILFLSMFVFTNCTDYVQDIDDKYDEWLARTNSTENSSSSVIKSSSSKKRSSSSVRIPVSSSTASLSSQKHSSSSKPKSSSSVSSSSRVRSSSSKKSSSSSAVSSSTAPQVSGWCVLDAPDVVYVGDTVTWRYLPEENSIDSAKFEWKDLNKGKDVENGLVKGTLTGFGLPKITVTFTSKGAKLGPELTFGGVELDCRNVLVHVNSESISASSMISSSSAARRSSSSGKSSSSALPKGHCAVSKSKVFVGDTVEWYVADSVGRVLAAYHNWSDLGKDGTLIFGQKQGNDATNITVTYSSPGIKSPMVQFARQGMLDCNLDEKGNPYLIVEEMAASSASEPPLEESSASGGTCAPLKAIVDHDEDVIWKYTVGGIVRTTDMLSAKLKWSTPGGTPEVHEGKGAAFLNDTVAYATSGQHTASLALSTTKGSFNINCEPVQVGGAKITDCKCETEVKSVDFTVTPNVKWSVSGCSTSAGLELAYEWDGTFGTSSYTKTFTTAISAYAPKLVVMNNDNTIVEVNCPSVKITDGPVFEITTTQGAGAIDLPKGTSAVVVNVNNDGYVFCKIDRVKANSSIGAFSGTINKVPISGQDYKEVQVIAGGIPVGTTLMFDIDVPLTCGVR